MTVRLVRIGNSRGIRLPHELLRLYHLQEGDELDIEERREGLFVRVRNSATGPLSWEAAYQERSTDAAEREEWSAWDTISGDGVED
jgi:antitoxin component of MazEF toxin-antitoxin module